MRDRDIMLMMIRKTLTILSLIGLVLSLWLCGMVGIHLWMLPATFALLLVCCRVSKKLDSPFKGGRLPSSERFEEGVGVLRDFEKRMMDWLLDGDDPMLEILRQQFADAHITEREDTGNGIFLHFRVPPETERISKPRNFQITDVGAQVEGVATGVSFMLFVRDGRLDFLEAGVNGNELWPEHVELSRLWYYRERTPVTIPRESEMSDTRDLAMLRRSFAAANVRSSDSA